MDDTNTITEGQMPVTVSPEEVNPSEMDTPKLVELYNKLTGKSIKRFSSRGEAIKRVKEAMGDTSPDTETQESNVTNVEIVTNEKVKRKASAAKKNAKVKAKAKSAPKVAAKSKEPKVAYNGGLGGAKGKLLEQFNVREGSNRQRLVEFMVNNLGKSFLMSDLVKATYGKKDDEAGAKLFMVMKGMQGMIDKYKIKAKIERTKTEEGMTYGLKSS